MTRRWSLVSTIAVLAVALAFVVVHIVRGQDPGGSAKQRADAAKSAPPSPSDSPSAASPTSLGWWPLHRSGTAEAGEYDAVVTGGSRWVHGPEGGALWLDGSSGYAHTGTKLDTVHGDYSVAARVQLLPRDMKGFHTAVSQDGAHVSSFFLQYSGPDEHFAFSVPGARTIAQMTGKPQAGHWYQLTGTYSHKHHRMRIYVNGMLAGSRKAVSKVEPVGGVVIGRAQAGGKKTDFWRGGIADVHVYDRELTPDQVATLSSREPD